MSWFRIDDQAHAHRKFRRAAKKHPAAIGLWAMCGSYASSQACDGTGHLQRDEVEEEARKLGIRDWEKAADALVTCGDESSDDDHDPHGLWELTTTGFQFHDWEHYREGGEAEMKRAREANKARQKSFRERHKRAAVTDSNVTRNVTTNVTRNADRNALPDPTRPDPARERGGAVGDAVTVRASPEPPLTSRSGEVTDSLFATLGTFPSLRRVATVAVAEKLHGIHVAKGVSIELVKQAIRKVAEKADAAELVAADIQAPTLAAMLLRFAATERVLDDGRTEGGSGGGSSGARGDGRAPLMARQDHPADAPWEENIPQ